MSVLAEHNKTSLGIILAAGRGQRINYLDTPKPLMRVFGKPLVVRQLELLREAGMDEALIVVNQDSESRVRECVEAASLSDMSVTYIINPDEESSILKSFELAASAVKSTCMVASCDLVFENNPYQAFSKLADIEVLVSKHEKENQFAGAPIRVQTRFGQLLRIGRNLESYNALHAGIYFFTKKGFTDFLAAARNSGSEEDLAEIIMRLHRAIPVKLSFLPRMTWFDINTPDTLLRAEMYMRRVTAPICPSIAQSDSLQEIVPKMSFTNLKTQETGVIIESGILGKLGSIKLMEILRSTSRHIIITDEHVDMLVGDNVFSELQKAGYQVSKLVIPAGEQSKSMSVYNDLAETIIALGIDEHSVIFALGGGVVANISGFLAATLYRGIGLIHLPTTLMNMLDVSISLKQGINGQKGKNLVGSYYQPLLVVIDPAINMPDRLISDGISEAIKHAICQDEDFFKYLLDNAHQMGESSFRVEVIERTVRLKIELMHEDMFEHKRGMILQYGHEFGHAVEFLSKFELTHGQSIAIGMRVSAELAKLMEAGDDTVASHKAILQKYELPYHIPEQISPSSILDALQYNKKNRGAEVRFVLPDKIGKVWKIKGEYGIPCPQDLIHKAIEKSYE